MELELCAASIEAVQLAKKYNFNRIELCQNLEQGGITPSIGMIQTALKYNIDTHVLVRPRIGSFIYSSEEKEILTKLRESENFKPNPSAKDKSFFQRVKEMFQ